MYKTYFFTTCAALFPIQAYAAMDIVNMIDAVADFFGKLVPVFISIAVVVFMWGIVKFIAHADDTKAVEEGKMYMIWGLVGLFVIVTLWSIVGYFQNTLGLNSPGSVGDAPTIKTSIPIQ